MQREEGSSATVSDCRESRRRVFLRLYGRCRLLLIVKRDVIDGLSLDVRPFGRDGSRLSVTGHDPRSGWPSLSHPFC